MQDCSPGDAVEFAEAVYGGAVGLGDPVEGIAAADGVILGASRVGGR